MPGADELTPGRSVRATAPVRVCDVGGWTDTWFGSPGQVCSLAVGAGVGVEARLVERAAGADPVRLRAPDVGLGRWVGPRGASDHPLLVESVATVLERSPLGEGVGLDVSVTSAVPPGASLGTSAAVVVAVLGALDLLVAGGHRSTADLAVLAHHVETVRCGRQAGVQDGWAAAVGGAADLRIGPYPEVRHLPVVLSAVTVDALRRRLVTVAFGPHDSSAVHDEVITATTGCGGADHDRVRTALRRLSTLAGQAAAALGSGDLERWGEVLCSSTAAQGQLHPDLVGRHHRRAIDLAAAAGAVGWKVNGAGGDGGSLTVLAGPHADAAGLRAILAGADPGWQVLDLAPAPGLRVEVVTP